MVKSTARDMAAYYRCLSKFGVHEGRQVLPRAAVERMIGAEIPATDQAVYGLGLYKRVKAGHVICEHSGGLHGVSTKGGLLLGEGYGFAVLCSLGDADMDDIIQAAKSANIHEDIMAMPDGYGTQVGERGLRLSGGQKQRVAIARAILRRSPVIILDEATASVDVETERQIREAISEIAGTRTIIAIAHRLSTVRGADKILVIEDGRVVEEGTHAELTALGGVYARMDKIQNNEQ